MYFTVSEGTERAVFLHLFSNPKILIGYLNYKKTPFISKSTYIDFTSFNAMYLEVKWM